MEHPVGQFFSSLTVCCHETCVNSLLREQCLSSRCLVTDVSVVLLWLRTFGFQASCHNIVTIYICDYRRVMDWWVDLLTTYTCTRYSELQIITTLSLIYTIYKSPQHPLSLFTAGCLHQLLPGNGFEEWKLFSFTCSCSIFTTSRAEFSSQLTTYCIAPVAFKITPRHGPRRKHSPSIVVEACLPRRCLATALYATI
jgi:hypothetical protein